MSASLVPLPLLPAPTSQRRRRKAGVTQNSQGFLGGMASSVSFHRQRDPGESPCTALRPTAKSGKPQEGGAPEGLREAPEGTPFLGKVFLGVKGLTVSGGGPCSALFFAGVVRARPGRCDGHKINSHDE